MLVCRSPDSGVRSRTVVSAHVYCSSVIADTSDEIGYKITESDMKTQPDPSSQTLGRGFVKDESHSDSL